VPTKVEQAEATRARLLKIANHLFGTKGYEDTSIDEVLERAGVSKGALYHHFPSKEALFEAVFIEGERDCMKQVAAAAMIETDHVEQLRAGCQKWLDLVMDRQLRRIAVIDGPAVLGWQRWREIDEQFAFGLTKKSLQMAMEAGRIREQNVDMLAHMTLGMLGEAAMLIARAPDPQAARDQARDVINRMIDALVS
jgi:AcrR family transcriptional regulator